MKVFVVTSGCYSDFCISAIFSTNEKAEHYLKEHSPEDPNDIEEYELDEYEGYVRKRAYFTTIDLESGAILREESHEKLGPVNARSGEPKIEDFRLQQKSNLISSFGYLSGRVISYVDSDHSRKLAAELRQQFLREDSPSGTPASLNACAHSEGSNEPRIWQT